MQPFIFGKGRFDCVAGSAAVMVEAFFNEVFRLVDQAERQYGLANRDYTDYIIERLEFVIIVCSDLFDNIRGVSGLEDYCRSVGELVGAIRTILRSWEEYEGVLDANLSQRPPMAYHLHPVHNSRQPGRPQFNISKEQLEYLRSLGFHWNEISILLGVSRMTIYR